MPPSDKRVTVPTPEPVTLNVAPGENGAARSLSPGLPWERATSARAVMWRLMTPKLFSAEEPLAVPPSLYCSHRALRAASPAVLTEALSPENPDVPLSAQMAWLAEQLTVLRTLKMTRRSAPLGVTTKVNSRLLPPTAARLLAVPRVTSMALAMFATGDETSSSKLSVTVNAVPSCESGRFENRPPNRWTVPRPMRKV